MHSRVSGLAQAISAFVPADAVASDAPVAPLVKTGVSTFASTSVALAVVSMVDVMKQFDANGNQVGAATAVTGLSGAQLGAVTMQGNAANVYGIGDSRQSN